VLRQHRNLNITHMLLSYILEQRVTNQQNLYPIHQWMNKYCIGRKNVRHVDIWNREKKFELVRDELMHYLTPNITFTLCWANPLCVFEKSLREKAISEIEKEAIISYREAQKMSLTYWEDRARVKDALILYWWQKDNFHIRWVSHPFDSDIIATLQGTLPRNFRKMVQCYKEHVQYLYDATDKDRMGYTDAGANLYHWKRWTERLESDLEILLEGLQNSDILAFEDSPFLGCKTLKGCTRDILMGRCGGYVGYIGEEQEMREEEIEKEEKCIQEMREEEIERLEELEEDIRAYGSD